MELSVFKKKELKELLDQCAPSSQNNERAYWRRMILKWWRNENPSVGRMLEEKFGLSIDYKDRTWGHPPRHNFDDNN